MSFLAPKQATDHFSKMGVLGTMGVQAYLPSQTCDLLETMLFKNFVAATPEHDGELERAADALSTWQEAKLWSGVFTQLTSEEGIAGFLPSTPPTSQPGYTKEQYLAALRLKTQTDIAEDIKKLRSPGPEETEAIIGKHVKVFTEKVTELENITKKTKGTSRKKKTRPRKKYTTRNLTKTEVTITEAVKAAAKKDFKAKAAAPPPATEKTAPPPVATRRNRTERGTGTTADNITSLMAKFGAPSDDSYGSKSTPMTETSTVDTRSTFGTSTSSDEPPRPVTGSKPKSVATTETAPRRVSSAAGRRSLPTLPEAGDGGDGKTNGNKKNKSGIQRKPSVVETTIVRRDSTQYPPKGGPVSAAGDRPLRIKSLPQQPTNIEPYSRTSPTRRSTSELVSADNGNDFADIEVPDLSWLKGEEKGKYQGFWLQACSDSVVKLNSPGRLSDSGIRLATSGALGFIIKSRLPPTQCESFVKMAQSFSSVPDSLDETSFYLLLKMVALAQNKHEVSLENLPIRCPLPSFFAAPMRQASDV